MSKCSIFLYINKLQIISFNDCIRMAIVIIRLPPTAIISSCTAQTITIQQHEIFHRIPKGKNLSNGGR